MSEPIHDPLLVLSPMMLCPLQTKRSIFTRDLIVFLRQRRKVAYEMQTKSTWALLFS